LIPAGIIIADKVLPRDKFIELLPMTDAKKLEVRFGNADERLCFKMPIEKNWETNKRVRCNYQVKCKGTNWWITFKRTDLNLIEVLLFHEGSDPVAISYYIELKSTISSKSLCVPTNGLYIESLFENNRGHGPIRFVSFTALVDPTNGYLVNGEATVYVYVNASQRSNKRKVCVPENVELSDSDATIVVVGNNKIPVHKFVLCVQSPVFKKMFSVSMSESLSGEIKILDFPECIVQKFVRCLYNEDDASHIVNASTCEELFKIAHKYEAENLLRECEFTIANTVDTFNAVRRLEMGSLYESEMIKDGAMAILTEYFFLIVRNQRAVAKLSKDNWTLVVDAMDKIERDRQQVTGGHTQDICTLCKR
jgi:hypothetical protein